MAASMRMEAGHTVSTFLRLTRHPLTTIAVAVSDAAVTGLVLSEVQGAKRSDVA